MPSADLARSPSVRELMTEIETVAPEGGSWCSVEKATALASLILAVRPRIVVELGVWRGGSAIPIALALRHNGRGQLIAIDSWSKESSIAGQEVEHATWWGETMGDNGHDDAFRAFEERLQKHDITHAQCRVLRMRTDEAPVPNGIDVLHHDANHGPQVVDDIARWAPSVRRGGFLIIDDLNWPGGHVARAHRLATNLGFVDLYPLGTGSVLQRIE